MNYQEILYEVNDHIAVITINRPEVLNALKATTKEEISSAIDMAGEDENVRGVIITGTGRGFISGNDISEIHVDAEAAVTVEMSRQAHALFDKFDRLGKPIIAAVNGYAMGGGAELALACDLRVASTKAVFALPEVRLGVAPCYGGTQRLPRLIGAGRAKDLLFTGRKVSAEEAYSIGLVERLTEPETLMEEATGLMRTILRNGPIAVSVCKELVNRGLEMELKDGLEMEAERNGMLAETEDAREGVRAFFEKRPPVFRNH